MRLKDKVAIITGAARGIGKATAELFAQEGAKVVLWDLLPEVQDLNINEYSSNRLIDITDKIEVEKAVAEVYQNYGRIDILINNAGITKDKTLLKMSDDEWDQVINVNLNGVFYCTRAVAHYMKEQSYGRIISAASTVAIRGNYGQTNYVATKAGIIGMTKTWALELGRYGITVNCIAPGYTLTPMTEMIPDNIKQMAQMQIPVGFIAEPIDIAYGYAYLASNEARFVTGICLPIDGGQSR